MAAVLEARNLTKRYWDFALENLDLDLPVGRITGLVGPSGAGKTTLIRLIMNLIPADTGTVEVFGLPHDVGEKEIKNRIGLVVAIPWFIGVFLFVMALWTYLVMMKMAATERLGPAPTSG